MAGAELRFEDPFAGLSASLAEGNRALLGTPGYALPDITGLVRSQLPHGINNFVFAPEGFNAFQFDIDASAQNNILVFDKACTCAGRIVLRGSDNLAIVRGASSGHQPMNIHFFSRRGLFFFGDHSTSNTATFEIAGDDKSIIVGEDCMFSAFIDVTTDDRHGIFEFETGVHLNPPASVHLAPHVWVGLHATVLKGADIGFGSIVAARTVVSRSVSEMTLIGGIPGKPLKTGVTWTRAVSPNPEAMSEVRAAYQRLQKIDLKTLKDR